MKNLVIGLHGKARSGKDTVAQTMLETATKMQLPAMRIGFSGPIKTVVHQILLPHMPIDDYYSDDWREKDLADYGWAGWTLRKMWQKFGTEAMRGLFGDDVWVHCLRNALKAMPEVGYVIFIPDVRFPNELEGLKQEMGDMFVSVKVSRDGYEGDVGEKGHESEAYELDTDYCLSNNGTLVDIQVKSNELIEALLEEKHEAISDGQIKFTEDKGSLQDPGA